MRIWPQSGKTTIMYEWVTEHNANANDDIHACVALHDAHTYEHIHWASCAFSQVVLSFISANTRTVAQAQDVLRHWLHPHGHPRVCGLFALILPFYFLLYLPPFFLLPQLHEVHGKPAQLLQWGCGRLWRLFLSTGPNEELVAENDVVNGLYSDFCPMLRQPPYTMMVKIRVQQKMAETMYQSLGTAPSEMSNDALLMLSLVHDIVTDAVFLAECPDSESWVIFERWKKRMRSNITISGDHEETVLLDAILPVACQTCPMTQTTFPQKWQILKGSSVQWKNMCGDYTTEFENDHIFEFANEENEENSKVIEDLPEENCKTIPPHGTLAQGLKSWELFFLHVCMI